MLYKLYTEDELEAIRLALVENNQKALEESSKRGYKVDPRILQNNIK